MASEIVRIWEMEKEAANLFGFLDMDFSGGVELLRGD